MDIITIEGGLIEEKIKGFKTALIQCTVKDENGLEFQRLIEIDLSTVNILSEKDSNELEKDLIIE